MNRQGNDSKTFGEKLGKSLANEDARSVYADTVTNAFVAAQIKALRENRGFSQEQLAELIGTKQSGVSRLERADYSSWKVETLRKLARAFHVRLRIRFEGFGTLLDEIGGFDNENLLPPKFEDDPFLKEQANEEPAKAETISVGAGAEQKAQQSGIAQIPRDESAYDSLLNRNKRRPPQPTILHSGAKDSAVAQIG